MWLSNSFRWHNYFDVTHPAVITPQQAYDSWDGYLENLYSNPDYHPIHFDEPGYGEDNVVMSSDLPSPDNAVVNDGPILVVDVGNVD